MLIVFLCSAPRTFCHLRISEQSDKMAMTRENFLKFLYFLISYWFVLTILAVTEISTLFIIRSSLFEYFGFLFTRFVDLYYFISLTSHITILVINIAIIIYLHNQQFADGETYKLGFQTVITMSRFTYISSVALGVLQVAFIDSPKWRTNFCDAIWVQDRMIISAGTLSI